MAAGEGVVVTVAHHGGIERSAVVGEVEVEKKSGLTRESAGVELIR